MTPFRSENFFFPNLLSCRSRGDFPQITPAGPLGIGILIAGKNSERRRGAVPSPAPPWSSSPSPGVLDQGHSAGTEVSSLRLMKGEKRARHFTSTIEFLSPALPKFPCVPSRPCRHNPRIALRTRRDSGSSVTITGMLGNLRGETFDTPVL